MLHAHHPRVEQNTQYNKHLHQWIGGEAVQFVLEFQPRHEMTAALTATPTVSIDVLLASSL